MILHNSCFYILRAGMLSKIINVLRSIHRDAYFNRVVLHLQLNSLKDNCKGVQFLVKCMLQTCNFTKNERYHKLIFKAFDHTSTIATSYHIFLQNNCFGRAPLESCFCVWKIWEISQASIWNNKKSSMLPINNCTKKLHCQSENFAKCLQNLSGITTSKNIFQQLFLLLLLAHQNFKSCICVVV